MRGLHDTITPVTITPGIIPARAGFTLRTGLTTGTLADHPRACGVYQEDEVTVKLKGGSSPRVRGLRAGPRGPR